MSAIPTDPAAAGRVGAILFDDGARVDAVLAAVVERLTAAGCDLAGVLQSVAEDPAGGKPRVAVREIRAGWRVPILEDRGVHARGCRLDPRAIAEVAGRLDRSLDAGADLLVINRFGKAETEGRGLRPVIERAIVEEVAVLVAVRGDFRAEWDAFHGGLARELEAEVEAVLRWCRAVVAGSAVPV